MSSIKLFSLLATLFLCSLAGAQTKPSTQFDLDDADAFAKAELMKSLATNGNGMPNSVAPSPVFIGSPPPVPPTPEIKRSSKPRVATEPVTFVGAYSEGGSASVLYQYNGAIYPGRAGVALLNGWIVESVSGFKVKVMYNGKTWEEPIVGGATALQTSNPELDAITSLSSPLPPALRQINAPFFAPIRSNPSNTSNVMLPSGSN